MNWLRKLLFQSEPVGAEILQEHYEDIVCLHKNAYHNLVFPHDAYASYDFMEYSRGESMGFFEVAFDVMKKLSNSYQVVSYVDSCEHNCRRKKVDVNACKFCRNFTAEYYRFLQEHHLTDQVFFSPPMELITITAGLNQPLVKLLAHDGFRDNPNAFYCYKEILFSCSTFGEIKEELKLADYDMKMVYTEEHDNLAIHVNTKTVDADQLVSQIEAVCAARGKKLQRYL